MPERATDIDLGRLKALLSGDYRPAPRSPFDVSAAALFGGISGLVLPAEQYEVAPGLTLTQTYAYLIAPFILAFAPPPRPGTPHPGPWSSLSERGLTILAEVRLAKGVIPWGFDRINSLWFLVALLRLRLALPLQMPVLADRAFASASAAGETANLIPAEVNLFQLLTAPRRNPSLADLDWIRDHIGTAAALMDEPVFNRAMQTFDIAIATHSPGAGIVIAWASIETLIRPGSGRITERVCRALAAHLKPPGSQRDRAFTEIAASYRDRGGAAHAGTVPEAKEFQTAFRLARAALVKTIEVGALPDVEVLLDRWRNGT